MPAITSREPRLPPPSAAGADLAQPAPLAAAAPRPSDEPSPFAVVLRGLGGELTRGEDLMRGAVHGAGGGTLDAGQLIALQAGVYRYSEVVDLTAKLVDHATSSLRTVLQGQ